MKKILLLMCLLSCFTISINAQSLLEIRGSKGVKSNTKESYYISFSAPLKVMTKIKISASHGKINSTTNSNFEEITVYPGNTSFEFSVYWSDVVASDAFIIAYKSEEESKPVDLKGIKITKEGTSTEDNTGQNPYMESNMTGGFAISDDIITFKVSNIGSSSYKIKEWIYDTSIFTEVSKNSSSITLKAGQTLNSKRIEISAKVEYSYYNIVGVTILGNLATHTLSFTLHGKPYIQNKENIICSGNTIYEIVSPFIPNTTTSIQWGTAENMKFISAGNPFLATYSSIAPGKTKVKATVTINGKDDNKDFHREYPIENSEVWVGAPPKLTPLILSPNTSCGTTAVFKIGDSSASLYTKSAFDLSTVDWISSETPSNKTKTSLSVYARYKGSVISVSANVTNKCGTSIGYQATTVVTGNCGIDPGPGIPGQPGLDPGLKSALSEPQPTTIRIYSYPTGSLVYQKKNTISFDIQSTNLGEGIYILEMTDQQGNVTREKVMKGKQ